MYHPEGRRHRPLSLQLIATDTNLSHDTITTPAELDELCRHLAEVDRIGFDTEFVSEDTFYPELCLIQVATPERMVVIDPYQAGDLTPFWTSLADGNHITIAHAAREELNFSLKAIDRLPANLFDTQLAAGFCSTEHPSSYASVVTKFLRRKPAKGEQRTDWRRRPLTTAQIEYALEDIRYLLDLHNTLVERIEIANRTTWYQDEIEAWQKEVDEARSRQRWQKVSGIGNLPPRGLAIVRELWLWRQAEAQQRNIPARRVLRDDLIVELAKRKSADPEKIRAIRGMHRGAKGKMIDQLAERIRRGLATDLDDLKRVSRPQMPSQLNLLGQFLSPALGSICRRADVATSLVGTASDVRDLIAYRLGFGGAQHREVPALAQGWRAKLVGNLIDDLLNGKKSIRIQNPRSPHPIEFDNLPDSKLH